MQKTIQRDCKKHGLCEFVLEGRGYYRCKQCRINAVQKRRKVVKEQLVQQAGGKCQICGYNRCLAALQFHHLDPEQKSFGVDRGATLAYDTMLAEAQKCALLCANCHAEVEDGYVSFSGSSAVVADAC